MFEVLIFCCFDELVADMVVDPYATHTESKHTQAVLVIVGQRAVADCKTKEKKQLNDINLY